jgi:hypothetical protein
MKQRLSNQSVAAFQVQMAFGKNNKRVTQSGKSEPMRSASAPNPEKTENDWFASQFHQYYLMNQMTAMSVQ